MIKHDFDDDATCVHCGLDGADVPRGTRMPACVEVSDEVRARRVAALRTEYDEPEYDEPDPELLDQLDQDAYMEACEQDSPNAPGFDALREKIYERKCEELRA